MVNTSSWGGNVVRDPHTGFHHLFYSEMRTGGLHSAGRYQCTVQQSCVYRANYM